MLWKIIRNAVIFLVFLSIVIFWVVYITDRAYALEFVEVLKDFFVSVKELFLMIG